MSEKNALPQIISVFAVGIAVGAALGLLFAPRSGEETRDFIRDSALDGVDRAAAKGREFGRSAQDAVNRAQERMNDAVDRAKERLNDAVDEGGRAYDEARRA